MKRFYKALLSLRLRQGAIFALFVALSLPCWSHEINLEWVHEFTPTDPAHPNTWRFYINSVNVTAENRILICGGKTLILPGVTNPSLRWLAQLDENANQIEWDITYGDSSHQYGARDFLRNGENLILVGSNADISESNEETIESRRPAFLYLNQDFDSIATVEFAQGHHASFLNAFVNEDGSVDSFVKYHLDTDLVFYKIGSDREVSMVREYSLEDDFGFVLVMMVKGEIRLRNGDYLINGQAFVPHANGRNGCGGFIARIDHNSGNVVWCNTTIDSILYRGTYVYSMGGKLDCSIEHSSGMIYSYGTSECYVVINGGVTTRTYFIVRKSTADGQVIWTRRFLPEKWSIYTHGFRDIIEIREDMMALFGYISYKPEFDRDRSEEGIMVMLMDTTGEISCETHIRGEHIGLSDYFAKVLQVESNRVVALVRNYYNSLLSIRFDLDPPDAAVMENEALPSAFTLSSPYPNPFNSSTRLDYTLPTAGRVWFRLYDLSGRMLDEMDWTDSAGRHSVSLDAEGLAAGVYVLELRVGNEVRRAKAVVVK